MHDGILFQKKFFVDGNLDDEGLNYEHSLEQYCFLFRFIWINRPVKKRMGGGEMRTFTKKGTFIELKKKIDQILDQMKFISGEINVEMKRKASDEMRQNLKSFLSILHNFKSSMNNISPPKWQEKSRAISGKFQQLINDYIRDFSLENNDFSGDSQILEGYFKNFVNGFRYLVRDIMSKKDLHQNYDKFSKKLINNLGSESFMKKINWQRMQKIKNIFGNLVDEKSNRSFDLPSQLAHIRNKNVCTANICLNFENLKNSLAIPIYIPDKNTVNFWDLDGPRKVFIENIMSFQIFQVEHRSMKNTREIDNEEFNELHSEKNVLAFIYQFNNYFGSLIGKTILAEGIDVQKNKIKDIIIQIYSTRNTCPSCELFLSSKFYEVFIALMESISRYLNLPNLLSEIHENETFIKKKLVFTVPNEEVKESEENNEKLENEPKLPVIIKKNEVLKKDSKLKNYCNWKFLEKLITNSPNFMEFKRTFFLSSAKSKDSDIYVRVKQIEEIIGNYLNRERKTYGNEEFPVYIKFYGFKFSFFIGKKARHGNRATQNFNE